MKVECKTALVALTSMALAMAAGTSAWAHHSNAQHDQNKTQTVTGVVKSVRWVNPHAYIIMEAPDARTGKLAEWKVEGPGVYALSNMGIKQGLIKVGDTVTLRGNPNRDGSPGGTFTGVTVTGQAYGR